MKDKDYVNRMPKEKLHNILLYNEQDVINLYHIFVNWKQFIFSEDIPTNETDEIHSIEDIEDSQLSNDDIEKNTDSISNLLEIEEDVNSLDTSNNKDTSEIDDDSVIIEKTNIN